MCVVNEMGKHVTSVARRQTMAFVPEPAWHIEPFLDPIVSHAMLTTAILSKWIEHKKVHIMEEWFSHKILHTLQWSCCYIIHE